MKSLTSHLISKERCPECAKLGKDISKDNLAVYSDGHKWCYSCGYGTHNKLKEFTHTPVEINYGDLYLPVDCDIIYPQEAIDWINSYGLDKFDLYNNKVMWSNSMQRLIFPVFDSDQGLIAWQGRSFLTQPKWYGKGNLKETFNFLGKKDSKVLVLVEDIVSAIKIAKCGYMAMPLYGSHIGSDRFKRLYKLFKDNIDVVVWLDPDKRPESLKFQKHGEMYGLNCRTVFSEKDPKELTCEIIKEKLK